MKSSDRLSLRRFARVQAAIAATLLTASFACGGPPGDEPEPLEGSHLVAGTSLDRYGLLVIPRAGGLAEFRSIEDPSTIRWTGRLVLPATSAAYSLGSATVIRSEAGASLYVASPESSTRLPDVPDPARWIGSPTGGAFVAGGWALIVRLDGTREIHSEGEILWAAPAADDRAVALVDGPAGPRLAVWEAGQDAPTTTRPVGTRGPVLMTGWGRVVIGMSQEGGHLVSWSLPELEPTEGLDVGGSTSALAASPSQHQVFAASAERGRLVAVDRYQWRTVGTTRLEAPLTAVRVAVTGDEIVAFDGSTLWSVSVSRRDRSEIRGEWREDLPLPLPGGRVLTVDGGNLHLLDASGDDLGVVDGPADAWWTPLRWGPRAPVTAVALVPEDTLEAVEVSPAGDRQIGLLTMGTVSGRNVADPTTSPSGDSLDPPEGRPVTGPEASAPGVSQSLREGFYAVANSSRQLSRLAELRRALEGSGYSTHVLPRIDEANDTWYRLLVGPYPSRPGADAVVRELRRQRGIDAWIYEVSGDGR